MLKAFAVDGTVEIGGMAFQAPGERRRYPVSTLGCKVLCTEHNRRLSPLDKEAGRFMEALTNGLLDKDPLGMRWFRGERLRPWHASRCSRSWTRYF